MTWWVLTQSLPLSTYNSLTIRAFTNVADHLFMSWSYYEPTRHPIYKTVRGKTVQCGFRYIWHNPHIAEQNQSGDTEYHTFTLTNLVHESTIWYYLHAPGGPYGLDIQGPLRHVTLPPSHIWPDRLYVATKAKGIYWTRSFSGPGDRHPNWIPVNKDLHSLTIYQMHADLLAPQLRYYALVGPAESRIIYKLEYEGIPWYLPLWSALFPAWEPLITDAEAIALTGSASGTLTWVTSDINHPGFVYALFNSGFTDNGIWCLRSTDYGATWAAFNIYAGLFNYEAGTILAGLRQGADPAPPGAFVYAALCTHVGASGSIWLSQDNGLTWVRQDRLSFGALTPRCLVDPTDHSCIYTGGVLNVGNLHELWRSTTYGTNLAEIDGLDHLGIMISPYRGTMWVHDTDGSWARVLTGNHIWHTLDYWINRIDHGLIQEEADLISVRSVAPGNLYLGRDRSGAGPYTPYPPHVVFASDDEGLNMEGKAGAHAHQADGGGDSIPWNCGGVCQDGIVHPYLP